MRRAARHLFWAGGGAALGLALATVGASAAVAGEQCTGAGPHLRVVVEGLRSSQGYISVELYPDDPKLFLAHNQQLVVAHDKLDRTEATVCLNVPKAGTYALSAYHDENGDDQFNRSKLGIPLEGFGLSNNPKIFLGLPAFETMRFRVSDNETTIHVGLRYFSGRSARDHRPIAESVALSDTSPSNRALGLP